MGVKQIDITVFLKYLKHLGLVHIRTKSSHHIYDYPDGHASGKLKRPIVLRPNLKEIPVAHIHTNLKTAGIDKDTFADWLENYRSKK